MKSWFKRSTDKRPTASREASKSAEAERFSFAKQVSSGPAKRPVGRVKQPSLSRFAVSQGKARFARIRADFYEDLAETLLDKGSLAKYLQKHLDRQAKKRSPLASLYRYWLLRMDSATFSVALKGTVPTMDILVLVAAERSGQLPTGLQFLAKSVRSVERIKSAMMSAVAIPSVVLVMIVAMLVGFHRFMAPILSTIIPVERWPGIGRTMYAISDALVSNWVMLLAGTLAAGAAFVWALPNWAGPMRTRLDRLLPFSLYRDYYGSLTLVSLGGLMQSGASLVGSLKSIRANSSPWVNWHVNTILGRLDAAANQPATAFDTGLLPEALYERVVDYGERSSFQDALSRIGTQAIDRVTVSVQKKAKVVNNILLLVSGVLLMSVIASVMLTSQQAKTEITRNAAQMR